MLAHLLISSGTHDSWRWPKKIAVSVNEIVLSAWRWPVCVSFTDLDEVHDLGWRELTRYYRQAVDIAKTITGQGNESEAVSEFKSRLKSYSFYLNKQPFTKNESDEEAFQKCIKSKCGRVKCVRCAGMLNTSGLWIERFKEFDFRSLFLCVNTCNFALITCSLVNQTQLLTVLGDIPPWHTG